MNNLLLNKDLDELLEPALTVDANYISRLVSPFWRVSPKTAPCLIKFLQMNIDANDFRILLDLNVPTFKAMMQLPQKLS